MWVTIGLIATGIIGLFGSSDDPYEPNPQPVPNPLSNPLIIVIIVIAFITLIALIFKK